MAHPVNCFMYKLLLLSCYVGLWSTLKTNRHKQTENWVKTKLLAMYTCMVSRRALQWAKTEILLAHCNTSLLPYKSIVSERCYQLLRFVVNRWYWLKKCANGTLNALIAAWREKRTVIKCFLKFTTDRCVKDVLHYRRDGQMYNFSRVLKTTRSGTNCSSSTTAAQTMTSKSSIRVEKRTCHVDNCATSSSASGKRIVVVNVEKYNTKVQSIFL